MLENQDSVVLSGIGLLLGIIGFFLVGLIKKVEGNNVTLHTFCTRLEVLIEKLNKIQADSARTQEQLNKGQERNEKDIELVRARVHFWMNALTAVKLRLELQGIKTGPVDDWDNERENLK